MAYKNRVRLPMMFINPQFPTERNVFRLSNGVTKVQSVVIKNTYSGKTDKLPEDWHKKLVIALSHDTVTIENERLLSDVVLDGDYEISWPDFLQYPLAESKFSVQVTPFAATNSNCLTCSELSQVVCNDDSTSEVWTEGTTHNFPDVLTDNDEICCYPSVISLVYWNPLYFTAVSISASGVLTATVQNPCPVYNDVLIATYRVTCADGSYDEANVYGNITGSTVNFCTPAQAIFYDVVSSSSVSVQWAITVPPPSGDWIWQLFLTSDLVNPIQNGTVGAGVGAVLLTGLTAGISYTFSVISDCGSGNLSTPVNLEITITGLVAETCANFTVTYIPIVDDPPQLISYIDCLGEVQNVSLTYAQELDICMLIEAGETDPVYFVASSVDISLTYIGLC